MKSLNLQLYSVGRDAAADLYSVLKRTAELGYTGVEFAGYHGHSAGEIKKWLDEFSLKAVSTHTSVFGDLDAEIAFIKELGGENIVLPGTAFENEEKVLELAGRLNDIGKKCKENGLYFSYHNHSHEFVKSDKGQWLLDVLYENTDPEYLGVQLDVCWALVGGADPVEYLRKYKNRVKVVHMKEVMTISPYEGCAIGKGLVDFKGIYDLLGDDVDYIVEQEGIKTVETWEGLRQSAEYLKSL